MSAKLYAVTPAGRWLNLGREGNVGQVQFNSTCPGGPTQLTANLYAPRNVNPQAFQLGNRLVALVGTCIAWAGTLDIPQRPQFGQPWAITAIGTGAEGKRYARSTASLAMGAIVDAQIARGLNWSRPASIPDLPGTAVTATFTFTTLDGLLSQYDTAGTLWQVYPTFVATSVNVLGHVGVLKTFSMPTTPTLLVSARGTPGGRTLDGYTNEYYGSYIDSGGVQHGISTAAPTDQFGVYDGELDMGGTFTLTQANAVLAALVARYGIVPSWTAPVVARAGQIRTLTGGQVAPGLIQPGVMVQLSVVDPDSAGIAGKFSPQFVVGETAYDSDSDTVTLTPIQSASQTLVGALTRKH